MYTVEIVRKDQTGNADVEKARTALGMVGKGVIAINEGDGEGGHILMELESFASANEALAQFGLEPGTDLQDTAQKLLDLRNNPPAPTFTDGITPDEIDQAIQEGVASI